MSTEISAVIDYISKAIFASNGVLAGHFRGLSAQNCLAQMSNLLIEAIQHRKAKGHLNDETKGGRSKRKKDVTCKVTEMSWTPISPFKIYGKPRIKLSDDSFCVVHPGLSECRSQQSIRSIDLQASSRQSKENSSPFIHLHQKPSKKLKIQRVLQIKQAAQNQQKHGGYHKQAKEKCIGRGHIEKQKIKQQTEEQILLQREIEGALRSAKSLKMMECEGDKQRLEKQLLKQRLKLQKMEERLLQKHRKGQHIQCSCCSDDEELLEKLEELYFSHSKHMAKKGKIRHQHPDKTYKISASEHYPITSSQSSHTSH